jgi:hypothetical protein
MTWATRVSANADVVRQSESQRKVIQSRVAVSPQSTQSYSPCPFAFTYSTDPAEVAASWKVAKISPVIAFSFTTLVRKNRLALLLSVVANGRSVQIIAAFGMCRGIAPRAAASLTMQRNTNDLLQNEGS